MKENDLYVTDRGVFVGVESISGKSAFVKVLNTRDGKVIVQKKEVVILDRADPAIRDPMSGVETRLTAATTEQVQDFQRLINVKGAVAEDKKKTAARDDLTATNTSGEKRI